MSKNKKQYPRNTNYISEENNGIEPDFEQDQDVSEEKQKSSVYLKVVGCEKLRLREEPSDTSKTLAFIYQGQQMEFVEKVSDVWSKVIFKETIVGYVVSSFTLEE